MVLARSRVGRSIWTAGGSGVHDKLIPVDSNNAGSEGRRYIPPRAVAAESVASVERGGR